jgi:hypothetical protein
MQACIVKHATRELKHMLVQTACSASILKIPKEMRFKICLKSCLWDGGGPPDPLLILLCKEVNSLSLPFDNSAAAMYNICSF